MDRTDRSAYAVASRDAPSRGPSDDVAIVARTAADEAAADQAAADEARARFRREGPPGLSPDERIAPLFEPDEQLIAIRHAALLDRRDPAPGERLTAALEGELYVTSGRLLLVGRLTLEVALETIEDAVLSGERLLLVLRDGRGVTLQVGQPRLLCVEIAAARAAARSAQARGPAPGPSSAAR